MRKTLLFSAMLAMMMASCTSKKLAVDTRVDDLLAQMTTREKVAQLITIAMDSRQGESAKALQDSLVKEGIGGFIVMDDQLVPNITRLNHLQELAKIPLIISIDGEWGPSMRFSEFPFFPRQMQLGALASDELVYKMGVAVGEECKLANILIDYAPVADVNINPANPVIGTRSFGEDKVKVAQMASAYMRGMQDAGIYACAKHFPGHGDTNVDSHKGLPVLEFTRERLDSIELYPFRKLIDDGVAFVMMGHLLIPALDSTVSSISKPIVTGLLKEELGFNGVVVTDALGMKGVAAGKKPTDVNLAAYKAGVDIMLMPNDVLGTLDLFTKMVEDGELDAEDLDRRVRKALALKRDAGLLDEGYTAIVDTTAMLQSIADRASDYELIREISRQSMTLVKCDEGALPAVSEQKRVAYLGYGVTWQQRKYLGNGNYNGLSGFDPTSGVTKDDTTVLGETLAERGVDVFYLPSEVSDDALLSMKKNLEDYDAVILGIHDGSARPKTVLIPNSYHSSVFGQWAEEQPLSVVYFGSPYCLNSLTWSDRCELFMIAYSDNVLNEQSVAEILTGQIPAQGVLPVSAGSYKCGFGINTK